MHLVQHAISLVSRKQEANSEPSADHFQGLSMYLHGLTDKRLLDTLTGAAV